MSDVLGKSPQEYYNKEQAKLYELSGAFKRIQESMTRDALSIAGFKKNAKVLDLGCGTGFSTQVLKDNGFNVTGCDINENMLYYARKKGLTVFKCSMTELPFKDGDFDNLISISTIQWAKPLDYELILSEINRVIKESAVVQFYPKSDEEFDYFCLKAKKYFSLEKYVIGVGHKTKTYIMLKKRG